MPPVPQSSPLEAPQGHSHAPSHADANVGGVASCEAHLRVGQERHSGNSDELRVLLNERHEQWLREQYLRGAV